MVKENSITRVAFSGNTKLTLKCMEAIGDDIKIVSVFGLSDKNLERKTNHVRLDEYCNGNNIKLFKSEDWEEFGSYCKSEGVEIVIIIGDSRIVPKTIIDSFSVIGNHGAILPFVQGAASFVWGRLLNTGTWGISIMRIDEQIDSGTILKTKEFSYEKDCTEQEFVEICYDLTVEALLDVLQGDYFSINNKKYNVRISKHTDSEIAIELMRTCLENNLCIYMPPRTIEDGELKNHWSEEFKTVFKIAQNEPYPTYTTNLENIRS